ncbi:unnamed protein product [marine sediment metagenome]|uniref:Uncharacterized protein n=1 Tax=marine sediment metagenome TaxID=412755 RepID=X1SJD7_9ZZZZ
MSVVKPEAISINGKKPVAITPARTPPKKPAIREMAPVEE